MRNILKIFAADMGALKQNVVSVILAVGLIIMPSMFVWYNVLACWDVFGNTGNLKVAVANTDVGYNNELLPMELNVGEQVVNALRANDQMNWVFTNEEDAIDGAASGRYYAALVIPESFSQEIMTFYTSDAERAPIIYYSNEKKSAIAPKVTDQGADQISYQVNKEFAETLSEVALNIAKTAIGYVDDDTTTENIDTLIKRLETSSVQMKQHASSLSSFTGIIEASQGLITSSQQLLDTTKASVDDVANSMNGTQETVDNLTGALTETTDSLSNSISVSISNYENTANAIDTSFNSAGETANDTANALQNSAEAMVNNASSYQKLIDELNSLSQNVPEAYQVVIQQFVQVIQNSIDLQNSAADTLKNSADSIRTKNESLQEKHVAVREKTDDAIQSLKDMEQSYANDLKPKLNELSNNVARVSDKLNDNYAKLSDVGSSLSNSMTNADSKLSSAKNSIENAVQKLNNASDKLQSIADRLNSAMNSGGVEKVKEIIGDNPSILAESLSAPIEIERIAEFPVANFGSAMSPLYASLGLWVGSLLSVVLIKTNPNEKTLERCKKKPHLHEIFLGRFGVFAVIAILQSLVMSLGNLVFLEVQAVNPVLYVLCFLVSGLVFQFIMYTLVASFGNVGKAIAVLLLIIQVTGAGGSFPLQLLPDYATIINPFLPATYAINAMRASMMGLYNNDYWIHLAGLLAFCLPMILLGLILRRPFVKLNEKFVERVEKSKLI